MFSRGHYTSDALAASDHVMVESSDASV